MSPVLAGGFLTTGPQAATAAAESLQSCPTLCDSTDGSPPGSHPWDSPGKKTGVGCHFRLQCRKVKVKVKSLSVRLFRDPMDYSLSGSSLKCKFSGVTLAPLRALRVRPNQESNTNPPEDASADLNLRPTDLGKCVPLSERVWRLMFQSPAILHLRP